MQSSTEDTCPWWGKIGFIWLILIPLAMTIYVLAQPLAPNDFWYHLRAGEWMVTHRSFLRVAMFTPSVPAGTPYFYQSWIAEIVMYLTAKWTGLAGSQILRAICFTSAIAIFIAAAQRRAKVLLTAPGADAFNDGARRVTLVGLFTLFMCIPNTDLRPQAFSLPLFAVFGAILFSWSNTNKRQLTIRSAWLISLMVIWANTHGAFATGLILLLLFCLGETLHYCFEKPLSAYFGKCLDITQLKIAWGAFFGSVIAACVNPRGWDIFLYVLQLTGNTINEKYNQEWQPPHWSDGSNVVFFCSGIVMLLALLMIMERCRNKKKVTGYLEADPKSTFGAIGLRPGELLVLAAFFVMGLRNIRSIIWFALLFIIAGTALLCRILPSKKQTIIKLVPPSLQKMNALIAIITGLLFVPFLPSLKPHLPWPKEYLNQFAVTTSAYELNDIPPILLEDITPVGAATFLRKHPPKGLLWNDMVFGSYLVWALYPERGAWADPRIELRPDAFWETYLDTCHAKNNPSVTLPQRGFSEVLINKKAANENKLEHNLKSSSHWKIVYEDQISLLFKTAL
ncbi:MAG: hypothetical protein ABI210_12005 [Abditibacteriaceae bacterium]